MKFDVKSLSTNASTCVTHPTICMSTWIVKWNTRSWGRNKPFISFQILLFSQKALDKTKQICFHKCFSLKVMLWTLYVLLFGNFCATCLGSQYKQNLSCCQHCFDILNLKCYLVQCLNNLFILLKLYLRTTCLK
jgi:hypothetical protein